MSTLKVNTIQDASGNNASTALMKFAMEYAMMERVHGLPNTMDTITT